MTVAAEDDADLISIAIGAAGSSGSGALGAAIAYNYIGGDPGDPTRDVAENRDAINTGIIRAYIGGNATVDSSQGAVNVYADSAASIVNVTVGAAGANNVAIAGSISINFMRNLVNASIQGGAKVTAHTDINVRATTTPIMVIVAGGASGASTGAAAIASATNDMRSDLQARIEGSGTEATATTGDIKVAAKVLNTDQLPSVALADDGDQDSSDDPILDAQIWSFTISGSGAGTVGGAASLSLNWIRNSVEARIADSAKAQASSGAVKVSASDQATLNSLAGGGSGAGTAAIGAAVGYNYVGGNPDDPGDYDTANIIRAYIDNATVIADTVTVDATSDADINTFSVSISGSGTFAGAGSFSLNWIRKTVDAHISGNASVTATGDIDVLASDTSDIRSGSAQISGSGTVAIGAAVAYNEIDNTVKSYVDSSSVIVTAGNAGNIRIVATSDATISTLSAGISGSGTASVAGSASSNLIHNDVRAYINGGTVTTDDNILVQAESDDTITSYAGTLSGSGTVGVGGTVVVNQLDNDTQAYISGDATVVAKGSGSSLSIKQWADDSAGTESTENLNGLAVIATNDEEIDVVAVSLGLAGQVGIGANVIVNKVTNTTRAYISDSSVNNSSNRGKQVKVRAHQHTDISSGGGALAFGGGAAGVGASIDTDIVDNTTQAYVADDDVATDEDHIYTGEGLDVSALSREKILSASAGVGVGFYAGVAGAASGVKSTSDTDAFIRLAKVTSDAGVSVDANSRVELELYDGAIGGGIVGAGGSVAVGLMDGNTRAYIEGATLVSDDSVQVNSDATENVSVLVGTLAVGGTGLGGSVSVVETHSNTGAWIGAYVPNSGAATNASVTSGLHTKVKAASKTTFDNDIGAGALGGGGIGASIDVVTVKNAVDAHIGANSVVTAEGNVTVEAEANRTIDSMVMAFAGGATFGISGAVSVISVGTGLDTTGNEQATPAQEKIDAAFNDGNANGLGSDDTAQRADGVASSSLFTVTVGEDPSVSDTTAYIGDGAQVTAGSNGASADILVKATDTADIEQIAGGAAIGGVGLSAGGSVGVLNLSGATTAYIDNNTDISATDDIKIKAVFTAEDVDVYAYGGSAGTVGLGAQVSVINDTATQRAFVDHGSSSSNGARITKADDLIITAEASRNYDVEAKGVTAGAAAAGAAAGDVDIGGSTLAYLGNYAQVGQDSDSVGDVLITATSNATVTENIWSVAAGIGAGSGNDARVRIDPSVKAFIGNNATVTVTNSVDIQAAATPKADVTVHGVNAGGLAVGVSLTDITIEPTVIAALGDPDDDAKGSISITAASLSLTAETKVPDNSYSAKSYSLGVAGALIGVDATLSTINNNSTVKSFVADGATLAITGATTLSATNNTKQKAEADSYSGGLLAAGGSSAKAKSNTTTLAFLGDGVDLTGSTLQITAVGNDDNYAEGTAGAGGLAGGSGTEAITVNKSTVTAEIREGASGKDIDLTQRGAGTLVIKAEQNATFDSKITVGSGGILGATGAKADHDVTANVTAGIGADAVVKATDIDMDAITKLRKNGVSGDNIKGTTGGVASAAGADSFTNVNMTTRVVIGDRASLTVEDGASDAGDMTLDALNDFILNDKVTLISGGAVSGAGSTMEIKTDTNIAEVSVGNSAQLSSVGDVQISARGTGEAVGKVNVETYGGGTVAVADTTVEVRPENKVTFAANSFLTTDGNLNISTGTDTSFNRDQYKLEARTDNFAGSAIPINSLDATAKLIQNNTITVAAGAVLETARDAKLHAERLGFADMAAKAKGVNWTSEVAKAISGGSELYDGTIETEAHATVDVDGTVRTGIDRKQELVLDAIVNGQVTSSTQTDGVTFRTVTDQLDSELVQELQYAQKQLNQYKDTNANLKAFYESEVTRITNELAAQGLWSTDENGLSGYNKQDVLVVEVDPIWAQAGTIDVRSDVLEGTGVFDAPGDASVEITNNTAAFLEIKGISIPDSNGGLFLNGVEVASNSEIETYSQADDGVSAGSASFSTVTAGGSANPPFITISNTFDESHPDNAGIPTPAITITGNVENPQGNLTVSNPDGQVTFEAQVRAENMNVVGKSVYISGLTDYSVGGETYSKLDSQTNNGQQSASDAAVVAELTKTPTGVSLYGDRIVISAEYLNLNGIMQSGKPDYTLTLGTSTASEIANISRSASGLVKLTTASTDDYTVYYNTTTGKIEIQEIRVSGGYIELEGHMLNTGAGEIRVLGGYGKISVTNNTAYDVVVHSLDASQRGEGTLVIKDKAKGTSENPHVTIYTKDENGVTIQEDGKSNVAGSDSNTYSIKSGWRYGWSVDVLDATRYYKTEKKSGWLGIDAFAKDPSDDYWDTTERLEGPTLTDEGPYFFLDAGKANDAYTYVSDPQVDASKTKNYIEDRWTTSTWYGKKTYYTKYVKEEYTTTTHTHTVKADYGVNINFIGYDAGNVSLTSTVAGADILIDGSILNSSGTTTITSKGDIRQTSEDSYITGKRVVLSASGDIGRVVVDGNGDMVDSGALTVNLADDAYASLKATAGGVVHIAAGSGDLAIDSVQAGSGETVRLVAKENITVAQKTSNSWYTGSVQGGTVALVAEEGSVGNSSSRALALNSGTSLSHYVAVDAKTDIYLKETSGDLRLKEAVSASGDVYINVASGSLKDANDSAVRDDRTYDELLNGVWSDLQLTDGTGAQSKIDQTLIDYASNREQEYEAYWQYRGMQADSSVYDANFVVSLSSEEQTYYTNAGWTDGEIQTLVNKRTEEYHSLHGQYGGYGDSYDDSFTYTLSDAERDSLTDSIKVWTEDELLNLFSAGLIEPITDTQTSVEAANISAAGTVMIVASGSIGSATGSQVIDLSGSSVSLTDDERVALAAAERTDVAYLAGDIVSAKVNFLNNGTSADTIKRTDGGNWLTDGFQAGMTIQVFGTADNANENGQFFTIDAVTANTITLSDGDQLSTEYRANITLAEIITDPTTDGASITGIRIDLRDDVDVDALGSVSATGSGDVFLGSELDVKLDTVVAGDTVRIKTGKSIINAAGANVTNVTSNDVILEAADGSIGSASDQIYINLAADAIFTARVSGDIYLTERTDDINVGTLYAQSGGIYLTAESGAIVDGLEHDFANISAATELRLTASSGVGEDGDYLETDLATDATLTIGAGADVFVHEVLGNMNIREVLADGGDVDLRTHLAIKDTEDASGNVVTGLPEADVIGNSITLTSENDAIGISGNDLDINSAYRSAGTVTTSSALNTYLIETDGDLSINTIGTGADYTAFILGRDNILNGNADANASNVTSGKTRLFAEGDIGASGKHLQTTVGYMEGRSTSGNVWITNTGHLTIGGLDQANGMVATGTVNIQAHSPITVEKSIITDEAILLYAGEDTNDVAGEEDDLIVKAGVTIQSTASSVTLRAGDDLMVEAGATVSAFGDLLLQGDYENLDAAGTTIHNEGTLSGANITIEGEAGSDKLLLDGVISTAGILSISGAAGSDDIQLLGSLTGSTRIDVDGGSEGDSILIDVSLLAGDTYVTGGTGDDTLTVNELHSRSDVLSLDGQEGGDQYVITMTDTDADGVTLTDYVIDVHDSGGTADGVDNLTIHGRGFAGDTGADKDDVFLIRSNFIARLHGEVETNTFADPVERINYDDSLNDLTGGVQINGGEGSDSFFLDDTSALMTIDGGSGRDTFQVGQIFGEAPVTAPGDEVAGTAVTRGYLSYGNSEELTLLGGDDGDSFTVYSNKAKLFMKGEKGNDEFVVRAFVADDDIDLNGGDDDDTIDYNVNAPLSIDGGSGFDTLTAIGTEADDTFTVTRDSIIGAGLYISYDGVESVDVDALEGNDTFIIVSTREGVITTLIGGLGSDNFIVGSEGLTSAIQGSLILEGGSTMADRSLKTPVVLPSEQATSAKDIPSITDETIQTDTMTVFNDASDTDDNGQLTASSLTGLNMDDTAIVVAGENGAPDRTIAGGMTYYGMEVVEVVMGSGNDTLAVDVTATSLSAAMVFSHNVGLGVSYITLQDGSSWFDQGFRSGDTIVVADTAGNDGRYTIASISLDGSQVSLASGEQLADETVTATVQRQNPIMTAHGGGNRDVVNPSSGEAEMGGDTITVTGTDTNNVPLIIFGDTSQDGSRYASLRGTGLDPVVGYANAGNDVIDASGALSGVVIYGGAGDDTLYGSQGNDQIAGGSGDDHLYGLGGNDHLYGDSGFNIDLSQRLSLATEVLTVVTVANPVNDGANADDLAVGNDTIDGGIGDDILFGDHGIITQIRDGSPEQLRLMTTGNVSHIETTVEAQGGDDTLLGGDDNDMLLAGTGADKVAGNAGDDILIGDNGEVDRNVDGDLITIDLVQNRTVDHGGIDTLQGNAGNDWLLGGVGGDELYGANEDGSPLGLLDTDDDLILGDHGVITLAAGQVISVASLRLQNGGNDTIRAGDGNNLVIAGFGQDDVTAGSGNDILAGDNATAAFADGHLLKLESTDADDTTGDNDQLNAGDGFNRIIGGAGTDTITTGVGVDHVIGDHGSMVYDITDTLQSAMSSLHDQGARDVINLSSGNNVVIAGQGNDEVTTTGGDDIVIGDNGSAQFTDSHLITLTSTDLDDMTGGDDTLNLGDGFNRVIGGTGTDTITGGTGVDHVLGDHGTLTYDVADILQSAVSRLHDQGARDVINLSSGNNVVIAGQGNDEVITTGDDDIVIGDNGSAQFTDGHLITLTSTDLDDMSGGDDTLDLGDGFNRVLGGTGTDTITGGTGVDHVLGDHGTLTYDVADILQSAVSSLHNQGTRDVIALSSGSNVVIAGQGNDEVTTTGGDDIVIGDNGSAQFTDGHLITLTSTDLDDTTGGDDTLNLGNGFNRVVGGTGTDTITSGTGVDHVLGDHGTLTYDVADILQSAESALIDQGARDVITLSNGSNAVIAGQGNDEVTTTGGDDIVIGDNGSAQFTDGHLITLISKDLDDTTGGDDILDLGDGFNRVIGGTGTDTITAGTGVDHALGDHGTLTYDVADILQSAESALIDQGARDVIMLSSGSNVVIAGQGNDEVTTTGGDDIVIGDNGSAQFTGGHLITLTSTDLDDMTGGDDTLDLGDGFQSRDWWYRHRYDHRWRWRRSCPW